jgi:hypothetical protein
MGERKEMNSTVMQLKERCQSLERDLENMVKLFFVYHKHLDSKVTKAKHSIDLSLDFIHSLTVQIDQLKLIIETHGALPEHLSESLKRELNSCESSPNSNSTQKIGDQNPGKSKPKPNQSQGKANQGRLLDSILKKKDTMVTELKESKNLLSLISDYLKKIQHEEEETGKVMAPEKILKIVDMDHLLKNTTDYFSTQMKSQHQEKDDKIALLQSYSQVMEDNLQKISDGIKVRNFSILEVRFMRPKSRKRRASSTR